jgi:hypothetical protein
MIDWNAIAALAGLAAAFIAVVSLLTEVRLSSRIAQVNLITHLEDKYTSEEFLKLRSEAAEILIHGVQPKSLNNALDHVLGFFEFLGLLRRQKVVSDFVLWHSFSSDLFYYFAAAQDYIVYRHERNKSVYADLLQLYKVMINIEEKEAGIGSPDLHLSHEDVKTFLDSESQTMAEVLYTQIAHYRRIQTKSCPLVRKNRKKPNGS